MLDHVRRPGKGKKGQGPTWGGKLTHMGQLLAACGNDRQDVRDSPRVSPRFASARGRPSQKLRGAEKEKRTANLEKRGKIKKGEKHQ